MALYNSRAVGVFGSDTVGYGNGTATGGNTHALLWTGNGASSYVDLTTTYLQGNIPSNYVNTFVVGYAEDANNFNVIPFELVPKDFALPVPTLLVLLASLSLHHPLLLARTNQDL